MEEFQSDESKNYESTKNFLPPEVDLIPKPGKDLLLRLLEIDPKFRLKSVLGLRKIAMFKDFDINVETLKEVSIVIFSFKTFSVSSNRLLLSKRIIDLCIIILFYITRFHRWSYYKKQTFRPLKSLLIPQMLVPLNLVPSSIFKIYKIC